MPGQANRRVVPTQAAANAVMPNPGKPSFVTEGGLRLKFANAAARIAWLAAHSYIPGFNVA